MRWSFAKPLLLPALLSLATLLVCGGAPAKDADPLDWPNWRGPNHDATSPATNLPATWDPRGGEGSNLLWKNEELGGRSTPIVMDGKLYLLVRHEPDTKLEAEKVVCVDAATGNKLWEHVFNVYLSDVPDTRVGWSSVVGDPETGRVYAQGVCGYFCCLEGETGKVDWERSLHEEYGLLSTYGGRTNFPLIYNDTVITSAIVIGWGDSPKWGLLAKPAHRFLAFDKATGELRWLKGTRLIPHDTTYSTPALTNLYGHDALVFGSSDGDVWALQAGTGLPIWNYPLSRRGLNVSPFVTPEGMVITGHSEENMVGNTMGAVVALDTLGEQKWKNYQVMAGKSSPLVIGDRLYIIDDRAKLFVFDMKTGEQIAKKALGTVQRSSPVYADGKIYTCTNNGRWYTLEPTADGVKVLHKMRISRQSSSGSPIVAGGRLYVPMSEALYCIGTEESVAAAKDGQWKDMRNFPKFGGGITITSHLQIAPYDSLLAPGESQDFAVRVFDQLGRYERSAKPSETEFSVSGPGSISSNGTYTAPKDTHHECALVTCKMGDLEATARVRIVPPLPWKFDFDEAEDVPLTWVGGRVRYVIRDGDNGNQYIAKPTELPTRPGKPTTKLGTRSRMWMGSPKLSNYTMQADVQLKVGQPGSVRDRDDVPEFPSGETGATATLPSIGLINSRYTFTLFGPSQEVRIYSWSTHLKRTQVVKKMKLDPNLWYTLKFKVVPEPDEDHAHLYAKVWPRDQQEPAEWTLELVDKAPNLTGAPGLFGDAKVAEIYVDNIEVTPN